LAKYTYALLPLEQHHKIERKKPLSSSHQGFWHSKDFKNKQTQKEDCVGTNVEIH
jgi:hypothetical protein